MLEILLSWIWIAICAFVIGFCTIVLLQKIVCEQYIFSVDLVFIMGLCMLTVFAQIFSLFCGVGLIANLVLLLIVSCLMLLMSKSMSSYLVQWMNRCNKKIVFSVIIVIGVVVLLKANQPVDCYDTYLYHAQGIRWIEEYGIVPGLGNLHSRFAFNSSFLALQALFSMKFVVGRSLHSVNGFFVWILLSYGILSMKTFVTKKYKVSDGLRISAFFVVGYILYMSSPNTDLMSSGMMIYILIKWTSMWEEGENYSHLLPYAVLCILGVWTASLKVSAGAVAVMAIFVAYYLMKNKKWRDIIVYIGSGLIVGLPWIIRNVIISGYILYPYGALDLFDFDWKIPKSEVELMSEVVSACARMSDLQSEKKSFFSLINWIPHWFIEQKLLFKGLFVLSIVAILVGIIRCVIKNRKRDYEFIHIFTTMLICFCIWFWTAPAIRFAPACTSMIIFLVFGDLYNDLAIDIINKNIVMIVAMMCVICNARFVYKALCMNPGDWIYCTDYDILETRVREWDGTMIYFPIEGTDQVGYHMFPSTTDEHVLDKIELRGQSIKEGFACKKK